MKKEVLKPVVLTGNDADFADRLREKYRAAVGGLVAQIEFGAMLAMKRDQLTDPDGATNRPGTGLKSWLKENAPEIHVGTAYRFMHCAEAAASVAKLKGSADVALLLGSAIDALSTGQIAERKRLEKMIAEFGSQRQLLLALTEEDDDAITKPKKRAGTNSVNEQTGADQILAADAAREFWTDINDVILKRGFPGKRKESASWTVLDRALIEELAENLDGLSKLMRKYLTASKG